MDSSFLSLERMTPDLFLSFDNPLVISLLIIVIVLLVTYIYFRYIIIPMRVKHLKAEENIRLQQAELMALFAELSPDLVLRFDIRGKVVLANNSAHQVFHKSFILGGQIEDILPKISRYNIINLIETGERKDFTVSLQDRQYQFILAGVPKIKVAQLYGRDITELKQKEKELKVALEKAEESQKLKADFLARISHEVRSPLVAIQGYSELIMNDFHDRFDDNFRSIFRSIDKNTKRLYRTVDLILNMSQLQTGTYEPRNDVINLEEMLNVIHSEFRSFAEEKEINFRFINNLKSKAIINADEYSMQQIFVNLVDNAIKFTERGEVTINIFEENSFKCVEIKDSGIGISEAYLKQLFSPFTQEKNGYTRPYEGTGLGLALVKNYIDVNNAKIFVNSSPQKGSTFTVKIKGAKQ